MPPVVFLTKDLFFSSQVSGVVSSRGWMIHIVSDMESLLQRAEQSPHMLALLDLSMPGLNVADAVARLRDAVGPEAAILAFGPHVHAAKLAAATKAGCNRVLTRGQFSRDMASVLAEFLAPDGA